MTRKRTNWRSLLLGLLAVVLIAFGQELAAGRVPVPPAWAWGIPIVVAGIVWLTPRLREEAEAIEPEEPPRSFADLRYSVPPEPRSGLPRRYSDGSVPIPPTYTRPPGSGEPPGAGVTP